MIGKIYIKTFGCQMNVKDTERMLGLLLQSGFEIADRPEDADVILVNTCSVREKPEKRILGLLGRWKSIKRENPSVIIGVAGCVAQHAGRELLDKLPYLDLVIGTQMVHLLPGLVERARAGERVAAVDWLEPGDPDLFLAPQAAEGNRVNAFISIMQGCHNHCAYCIVPRVRGPAVSRSADDVVAEVSALAGSGVREVTLLGQNVNAYSHAGVDFPALLAMAADAPGILRVRFTTSHPKDLDERIIRMMAEHPRIMEHIHLPVQSGSDNVLARMNRGYNRGRYLALVKSLRQAMPEIGLTTDLIVGFPGETEEDFQETLTLLDEVRCDETFSFRYSKRPGTAAEVFPGQVPEEVRYERLYRLLDRQKTITEDRNRGQVGKTHEVLIEGPGKTGKHQWTGRTRGNRIVHFSAPALKPGELVMVTITRALKHSLEGVAAGDFPAADNLPEEQTCFWR